MLTSKEVFAKRKEGHIQEAYSMALELVKNNPHDDWNIKALAYCIIDLIKQSVNKNDFITAQNFASDLGRLAIDKNDEILTKSVSRATELADPQKKIISDAKALSKQGRHNEALQAYRTACSRFPNDLSLHESLGWELYRVGKSFFEAENINLHPAKQLLAEYIKLKNERPSLLHSLFLRFADRLLGNEGFNLVAFLKLWDLNNLTQEDYEPYKADNGKTYPSIAEKVIQHAAKDALSKKQTADVNYMLPFIDKAIQKFPDNFWLIYYKAKLLHLVGQDKAALEFSTSVTKTKVNEYWAWALLAEILLNLDKEKAFSCYCKALLCRGEDRFLANVRVEFAELLIEKSLYPEAKYEIDKAIQSRENEGWKITETLINYQNSDWYSSTTPSKNNQGLYRENTDLAETLLFDSMPWLDAIVGDTFTLPNKPNKPRRKIFIALKGTLNPLEVTVPENKYNFKSVSVGTGIKIKGEVDQENRFQIYLIDKRETTEKWDIFSEHIGIVDHVNQKKELFHYVIDRSSQGIIKFSQTKLRPKVGDFIKVKYIEKYNKKLDKQIFNILTIESTNKIEESLMRTIHGDLSLKYKNDGHTYTYDEIINEQLDIDIRKPDFAFIDDYYVPKYILEKYTIEQDCEIDAKALFNGEKWNIFELRINNAI